MPEERELLHVAADELIVEQSRDALFAELRSAACNWLSVRPSPSSGCSVVQTLTAAKATCWLA